LCRTSPPDDGSEKSAKRQEPMDPCYRIVTKPIALHASVKNIKKRVTNVKWYFPFCLVCVVQDAGTNNMIDAVRFADNHLDDGNFSKNKKDAMTFGEFAKDFFTPKDPRGYRMRNIQRGKSYGEDHYNHQQDMLDLYFIPQWGDWLIDSLSDVQIEDYILGLKSKQTGKLLGDSMRNKGLTVMKIVLQEAKRQGFVEKNVAADISEITEHNKKRLPFRDDEMRIMFPEDDNELINIWGGLMWSVYFLIMRDTGFRPGEVAGLERKNYIPEFHGLYTRQSVDIHRKLRERIKTTGKGFDFKTGVLTAQTERLLRFHLGTMSGDMLFLVNGRFIIPETSNKHLKETIKTLGIPRKGRTQYSLRHSFETDLSGEISDQILLQLMAHTGYRQEYDHRTPETLLRQLQPVRKILEERGKDDQNTR